MRQDKQKLDNQLKKWNKLILIIIGLTGLICLAIGIRSISRPPEIYVNYPGPVCDGQTTISVAADGNKTKVRVSSITPYSWVEIRVTSGGQTTPYQNPTISENGDWVIWEWTVNNLFSTVTSVQFYTDAFQLGQGGIVCIGWPTTVYPSSSSSPSSGGVCYDFNGDNVSGVEDLMYVLEHWNTYDSQRGITINSEILMAILAKWNLGC